MKILKVLWIVFENICYAIGFLFLFTVLTMVLNGGTIEVKKDGKQTYCYSTDKTKCEISSEENKHD